MHRFKEAFTSEASRSAASLSWPFLVHTIFQVKQTGLTDILQLAAGLAHFCFLETHTNTRTPAKHCERPGTNLKDRKQTTELLSHHSQDAILSFTFPCRNSNTSSLIEVLSKVLGKKVQEFRIMLIAICCLTVTGESFWKVWGKSGVIKVTWMLKADLLNGRNSFFIPDDVSMELLEMNYQLCVNGEVAEIAASPVRAYWHKKYCPLCYVLEKCICFCCTYIWGTEARSQHVPRPCLRWQLIKGAEGQLTSRKH